MLINLRNKMKNQKGFTLVELMVVIAIIGILAAIAVPKLSGSTDAAKIAKIQADLRTIGSAEAVYYAQNGGYAGSISTLQTANLLGATPTPPTMNPAVTYVYDTTKLLWKCASGTKTYWSDGTITTT